jgi:hypothetical protein
MITVRFSEPDEFIVELRREFENASPGPARPIMRMSGLIKSSNTMPLQHLYLCATILNARSEVVRLDKYCGDLWNGPHDTQVKEKYQHDYDALMGTALALKLEVRGGVYEGLDV